MTNSRRLSPRVRLLYNLREQLVIIAVLVTSSLFSVGLITLVIGLIANFLVMIGAALAHHQVTIDRLIRVGSGFAGLFGLIFFLFFFARDTFKFVIAHHFVEEEHRYIFSVPARCTECKYYNNSTLLPCAVNPETPKDCSEFEPRY